MSSNIKLHCKPYSKAIATFRRLVRGTVLGFLGMLKDSHVWLQITSKNQISWVFGFPFNPLLIGMWFLFKIGGYQDSHV